MKSYSTVLSETKTLQDRPTGTPASRKESMDIDVNTRVPDKKLEMVYRNVPTVFNSINKTTQVIMGRDRDLSGSNVSFFQNFLDTVGEIGGSEHWDEILESVYRYQMIYGEAYVELIRDKNTDRVVDLALVDPKSVEYAKTDYTKDRIALDEFGNPQGYVQKLPSQIGGVEQVYEAPDNVNLGPNEVFIPRENIAHFKLYTFGEGFYPVGLVEPIYRDAERSHKLKEDYADKAHSTLFPTRVASVGDEDHQPTPQKIKDIRDTLVEAKHSTELALPNHVDLDMLEAEGQEALISYFRHFNDEMVAGMGIPKPFGTGKGDQVNRATLQAQDKMYQTTIIDIVNRTTATVEKQIFERIAESEGFDDVPDYEWDTDLQLASQLPM